MSRFHGPQPGYKSPKTHTKGILAHERQVKREEAVERNALHKQGKACDAPTCPYPEGGKYGKRATALRKEYEQRVVSAADAKERPSRSARRQQANARIAGSAPSGAYTKTAKASNQGRGRK